ncbi:MAG TPA: gamma-glutamylcyclotransferase family protein [Solirubrobacteraceae bacterium]|nr:gamma-glutamylcyclotransferase family protein [Solirubrobacteraceae bacterium]
MPAYFAYGSNMHPAVMAAWCEAARPQGAARLEGFRLAFTRRSRRWRAGGADVLPAPAGEVWGVLFEVSPADLDALDAKEFAAQSGYRRRVVEVSGRRAVTYEVIDKAPAEMPPRRAYVELLIEGARAHELPEMWIARLRDVRDTMAVAEPLLHPEAVDADPVTALRTALGARVPIAREGATLTVGLGGPPRPDQLALVEDLGWEADGTGGWERDGLRLRVSRRPVDV